MESIRFDGVIYHLPHSNRFRRHRPDEYAAIREQARTQGIRVPIRTYFDTTLGLDNCVLDGQGRLNVAIELGLSRERVPFQSEGRLTTEEAYDRALGFNDARRHDDRKSIAVRRSERAARNASKRAEKKSIRQIAAETGIPKSTVARDLSDVPPGTGDGNRSDQNEDVAKAGGPTKSEPPIITGIDGKNYPARSRRPKWMKPGSNVDPNHRYASILNLLSNLSRQITIAINEPGGEKLKAYLDYLGMIEHRDIIINGKKYGARFIGFRRFRRLIKLAGLGGRAKTMAELKAECARPDEESD